MSIRTFRPGDDAAQVGIYNEAAADLPRFKPATLDEVRRRCSAADFDPATRLYALDGGRPVGYVTFQAGGRVGYPWCRRGHEAHAGPLLEHALDAMRGRGLRQAFAAYRGDWPAQRDFFLAHGFRAGREILNFVMDLNEMPTPAARASSAIEPLTPADLPAVLALAPHVFRTTDAAALGQHLFHNPYFPPGAAFALRGKTDGRPVAVGIVVHDPAYANPKQLDAAMPCFRLGAFGSEGQTAKRVNGLFSFVAAADRDPSPLALDLLSHASQLLEKTAVETLAAQVPSDATHLLRFYKQYFRRQGGFPLYEREL